MSIVYITPVRKRYDRVEEIDHDWQNGEQFKLYNGGPASNKDALKLRMAGCTTLFCVYQTSDLEQVLRHEIENF